jgi:hypothetical protein
MVFKYHHGFVKKAEGVNQNSKTFMDSSLDRKILLCRGCTVYISGVGVGISYIEEILIVILKI